MLKWSFNETYHAITVAYSFPGNGEECIFVKRKISSDADPNFIALVDAKFPNVSTALDRGRSVRCDVSLRACETCYGCLFVSRDAKVLVVEVSPCVNYSTEMNLFQQF